MRRNLIYIISAIVIIIMVVVGLFFVFRKSPDLPVSPAPPSKLSPKEQEDLLKKLGEGKVVQYNPNQPASSAPSSKRTKSDEEINEIKKLIEEGSVKN